MKNKKMISVEELENIINKYIEPEVDYESFRLLSECALYNDNFGLPAIYLSTNYHY